MALTDVLHTTLGGCYGSDMCYIQLWEVVMALTDVLHITLGGCYGYGRCVTYISGRLLWL